MWPTIRPLWSPLKLCGPAFPVQSRPADNLAVHWAVSTAPAATVLVISHNGDNSCAGWGDITSAAAVARNIKGMVSDGAIRDTEGCIRLGLPIFSQGICVRGPSKEFPGSLNVPVVCAGVLVRPGDYIVGDNDGVVVVPYETAADVIRSALERDLHEDEVRQRLACGELTIDLFHLRPKLGLAETPTRLRSSQAAKP